MQWCGLPRPRRLSSVYRGRETSQDVPGERGKIGDTAWLEQRRESARQTRYQALSGEGVKGVSFQEPLMTGCFHPPLFLEVDRGQGC